MKDALYPDIPVIGGVHGMGAAEIEQLRQILSADFAPARGLPEYGCHAHQSSGGSAANGVWTAFLMDTEDYDVGQMYDPSSGIVTIPVTGRWEFGMWADWVANGLGMRALGIWANGQIGVAGNAILIDYVVPNASFDHPHGRSEVARLTAGAKYQLAVFQNSGTNPLALTATSSCPASGKAWFEYLGPGT